MLVTTEERELAKNNDVRIFPALGLFKNGEYLAYEGDLHEEMDILEWITHRSTLEISGKIEKVKVFYTNSDKAVIKNNIY